MKKQRNPSEIQAMAAARGRAWFVAAITFVVGIVMLFLSADFLALHCVMGVAVALSGGIAAARAAIPIYPAAYRAAGSTGGIVASLAYALPFVLYNLYRFLTLGDQEVARRLAALSSNQLAQITQQNIQAGIEFFRGQDVAYIFGYLSFALLFGWIVGSLGGALARRQLATV
jgi:hypothetical protein